MKQRFNISGLALLFCTQLVLFPVVLLFVSPRLIVAHLNQSNQRQYLGQALLWPEPCFQPFSELPCQLSCAAFSSSCWFVPGESFVASGNCPSLASDF